MNILMLEKDMFINNKYCKMALKTEYSEYARGCKATRLEISR